MGVLRTWPEHLDPVVKEFSECFDSMERYELLFQYAKRHPTPLPPDEWNDENQVHGCQSRAHVICLVFKKQQKVTLEKWYLSSIFMNAQP